MSNIDQEQRSASRPGPYQEITDKIIQQIEAGIIPRVQPWASNTSLSIPRNATTQRTYSGINIVLLWDALFSRRLVFCFLTALLSPFERECRLSFAQVLANRVVASSVFLAKCTISAKIAQ